MIETFVLLQGIHPKGGAIDLLIRAADYEGDPADYFPPGSTDIEYGGKVHLDCENDNVTLPSDFRYQAP